MAKPLLSNASLRPERAPILAAWITGGLGILAAVVVPLLNYLPHKIAKDVMFTGRVLDAEDHPVRNANVYVIFDGRAPEHYLSGSDGYFTLKTHHDSHSIRLAVSKSGYLSIDKQISELGTGQETVVLEAAQRQEASNYLKGQHRPERPSASLPSHSPQVGLQAAQNGSGNQQNNNFGSGSLTVNYGTPLPVPRKEIKLDPKLLDTYVGRYQAFALKVTIRRQGDHLFADTNFGPTIPLLPEGPNDFFTGSDDSTATFSSPNAVGKTQWMVVHEKLGDRSYRRVEAFSDNPEDWLK